MASNQMWGIKADFICAAIIVSSLGLQAHHSLSAEIYPRSKTDIILKVGDDFQTASNSHPEGTVFRISAGVHKEQRVVNPKKGTKWLGTSGAILDGLGHVPDAFHGPAERIIISDLEIRNYADNGIFLGPGTSIDLQRIMVVDTGSGDGEINGAIRLEAVKNLKVTGSFLYRVSSGILLTRCEGPIRIDWNAGINTGRNFIQLDQCHGTGIRVRFNSMERIKGLLRAGASDVEDWISVHKVAGTASDPAQFSYNRARGHGPSDKGSFIMLGDGGGKHQYAEGNWGINPGQVGIGLSGGMYIEAHRNIMFSKSWKNSNVAFYSCDFSSPSSPSGYHMLTDNRANWESRDLQQHSFWTDYSAKPLQLRKNIFPDKTVTAKLWDEWEVHVAPSLIKFRQDQTKAPE